MPPIHKKRVKPRPPLVAIAKAKDSEVSYLRYIGKNLTNHISVEGVLSAEDVEMFRVFPVDFLNEADTDNGPEAA